MNLIPKCITELDWYVFTCIHGMDIEYKFGVHEIHISLLRRFQGKPMICAVPTVINYFDSLKLIAP